MSFLCLPKHARESLLTQNLKQADDRGTNGSLALFRCGLLRGFRFRFLRRFFLCWYVRDDGRADQGLAAGEPVRRPIEDRHGVEFFHFGSAIHAEGVTDFREKHAKVINDFGLSSDGAARVDDMILLLKGDGRRNVLNRVQVRLGHLLQELAGVGGEAFDIPALALGIEGIEDERAFAATGEPSDDRDFLTGNSAVTFFRLFCRTLVSLIDLLARSVQTLAHLTKP